MNVRSGVNEALNHPNQAGGNHPTTTTPSILSQSVTRAEKLSPTSQDAATVSSHTNNSPNRPFSIHSQYTGSVSLCGNSIKDSKGKFIL